MTIKTREPDDRFKAQVPDFKLEKRKRPKYRTWREDPDVVEEAEGLLTEAEGLSRSLGQGGIKETPYCRADLDNAKNSFEPKADAKPDVKADAKSYNKILNTLRNDRFLSDTTEYCSLSESQLDVLNEICKLCIVHGKLSTAKVTYDEIASKASVNNRTIKGIARKLEMCDILIKRDNQYVSGSKGRVFEVSPKAIVCMLSHNQSLRKWVARQRLRVEDVKKFYDFEMLNMHRD
ncbi:MAG TPA: hypothetical protein VE954_17100 [Oligoflexus sp.]|uniref:hypothetical protein n=1 Tax=Oligoflexus sp. TaxID=1971216 RepID=UPI002D227ADC|nr:hypothetical protein [Oligoflexus sp.]HYX34817.1 hypothetical protein [Oligoflexus sp.]